jgi:CRISPR-associated protein Cas5t
MLSSSKKSQILRQMRRFKNADFSHPENVIPCYQEILSNLKCLIWVRSEGEKIQPSLRERIQLAFNYPERVKRFGCLFLGESDKFRTYALYKLTIMCMNDIWSFQALRMKSR